MDLYVLCRWSGWQMYTGTALNWTTSLGEVEIKDGTLTHVEPETIVAYVAVPFWRW